MADGRQAHAISNIAEYHFYGLGNLFEVEEMTFNRDISQTFYATIFNHGWCFNKNEAQF